MENYSIKEKKEDFARLENLAKFGVKDFFDQLFSVLKWMIAGFLIALILFLTGGKYKIDQIKDNVYISKELPRRIINFQDSFDNLWSNSQSIKIIIIFLFIIFLFLFGKSYLNNLRSNFNKITRFEKIILALNLFLFFYQGLGIDLSVKQTYLKYILKVCIYGMNLAIFCRIIAVGFFVYRNIIYLKNSYNHKFKYIIAGIFFWGMLFSPSIYFCLNYFDSFNFFGIILLIIISYLNLYHLAYFDFNGEFGGGLLIIMYIFSSLFMCMIPVLSLGQSLIEENIFLENNYYLILFVISTILFNLATVWIIKILFKKTKKNFYFLLDEPLETTQDLKDIDEELFEGLITDVKDFSKKIRDEINLEIKKQALVYCLDSSWGAGKTSFINMVKNIVKKEKCLILKKDVKWFKEIWKSILKYFWYEPLYYLNIKRPNNIIWIDYNPWHFNNDTELIRDFFNTLEIEINKLYGNNLGGTFRKYSELVTPVLENSGSSSLKMIVKPLGRVFKEKTLIELKKEITNRLSGIQEKVVIVLDDIDRLEPKQVMLVMRLVKMISDFPNIIFILPMDYDNVSSVIVKEYNEEYRNYLQKIVNFKIGLPAYTYKQLEGIFEYQFRNLGLKKDELKNKKVFDGYVLKSYQEQIRNFSSGQFGEDPSGSFIDSDKYIFINRFINKIYPDKDLTDLLRTTYHEQREDIDRKINDIMKRIVDNGFLNLDSICEEIYKEVVYSLLLLKNKLVFSYGKEFNTKDEAGGFVDNGDKKLEIAFLKNDGKNSYIINNRNDLNKFFDSLNFGNLDNFITKSIDVVGEKYEGRRIGGSGKSFDNDFKEREVAEMTKKIKEETLESVKDLKPLNQVYLDLKSIIIQTLLTPRDVKHFANKLTQNQNDLSWLENPEKLNEKIQDTIKSQVFPSL